MILVKLSGGLGNQMHQYAFGKLVADKLGEPLFFEINDIIYNNKKKKFASRDLMLEESFCLSEPLSIGMIMQNWINYNKFFRRVYTKCWLELNKLKSLYQPLNVETDNFYNTITSNTFLIGTWQAHEIFYRYRTKVLEMFQFNTNIVSRFEEFANICKVKEAVAIHVRRGDYLWQQHRDFNICTLDYFVKAILVIKEKLKSPFFYIFSDDITWCKENFDFLNDDEKRFVDFTNQNNPAEDLYCMSRCKHFIVSNSTFSYWGAFLSNNYNEQVVISPAKWFIVHQSNKLPPNWTAIEF